ncbi:LysR family transcriptional regulator [Piscinibacter terrae]|uniref:LysR family transcriptional regulator n=1 Tax=Piscinibacter terrae TaxID=2496871 RepID=A0A3N7HMI3_9BURK|nr:LysR family transcriptional regulator [Albitalea terrae]RQP23387.1 LysR family transcriptional regulator [Albitalea terrae]
MRIAITEEITFRKLEILLAFMETGNLSRAAEMLDLSTVSVHRALHSLEEALRCPLFRHEGRKLLPTEAARVLADSARAALEVMNDGIQATREMGGYSAGSIRIGSLYSLSVKTVPTLVTRMKQRRPDLQTELVMGSNAELLRKLRSGAADVALMANPDGEPDIESVTLFDDHIDFAAPVGSKYAHMAEVDLAQCADERFVALSDGFATREGFAQAFRIAGFTPRIVIQVDDIFTLINLVSGGVGCTLLPGRVRDVLAGKVQLIPLQPRFQLRQQIGLNFLRSRERDPNLLALASECRLLKRGG